MDKLINDFSFGLFFWQMLVFIVLIFLLKKYAWKPILNAVNEREESIENALKSAQRAREELKGLEADNEKVLKEARAERDRIVKEAREMKEAMVAEAKEQATDEAAKLVEAAKAQIENEKNAAVIELKNQVAQLSVDMAESILRRELADSDAQKNLVNDMIKEVKIN